VTQSWSGHRLEEHFSSLGSNPEYLAAHFVVRHCTELPRLPQSVTADLYKRGKFVLEFRLKLLQHFGGQSFLCEISGSHGNEYEDQYVLGCSTV
jgi:hypothetical protein